MKLEKKINYPFLVYKILTKKNDYLHTYLILLKASATLQRFFFRMLRLKIHKKKILKNAQHVFDSILPVALFIKKNIFSYSLISLAPYSDRCSST